MYIGPERQLSELYQPRIVCAGHLEVLRDYRLNEILPLVIRQLSYHDFDAIAFRGLSGALVAPIVAREMKKTLLCVRREIGETGHSVHGVEGDLAARRYVILDDFVSSGTTVRKIIQAVRKEFLDACRPVPVCIGICEYLWLRPHSFEYELVPAPRGE